MLSQQERRKAQADRFKRMSKRTRWIKMCDLEDSQRIGALAMLDKFKDYNFTMPLSRAVLRKLQRDPAFGWNDTKTAAMFANAGWIPTETLEKGRGNNVSAQPLGITDQEQWALNKAFYTELLGYPLILWDRRLNMKPSPLRRIFQILYHIAPQHQLKKIKLKALYDNTKRQLGCNDTYRDNDFEQRKKWNDEMIRVLNERVRALETTVAMQLRSAHSWLDTRGSVHERAASAGAASELARKKRGITSANNREAMKRMEHHLFSKRTETAQRQIIKEREARKMKLEKRLQSLTEANIIRSVESPESRYRVDEPPFNLHPRDILDYVVITTDLGKHSRVFRDFILKPISQQLYADCFWYIFCKYFQSGPTEEEETTLQKRIAAKYVRIVSHLNNSKGQFPGADELFFMSYHKDIIFKVLPFAMARAVILGFTFLCPASRHLYSKDLMENIYHNLYQNLFGVQVCDSSVQISRTKFFDELADHPGQNDQHPSTGTGTSTGTGAQAIAPTIATATGTGNETGQDRLPSLSDMAIGDDETAAFLPASAVAAAGADAVKLMKMKEKKPQHRLRQWRDRFGANMISPMVQKHLGTDTDRRQGAVAISLTRTMPVEWCKSGGMRNYSAYPSRRKGISSLHKSWREEKKVEAEELAKQRKESNKKLREIDESMRKALKGSRAQIGRYCIDMLQAKEDQTRRKRMEQTANRQVGKRSDAPTTASYRR